MRPLYGLKSSGATWRRLLQDMILGELKFVQTKAHQDVYIWQAVHTNGFEYYKTILVYVDNLLDLSKAATSILQQVDKRFNVKLGSVGPPMTYLGAQIEKYQLPDSATVWSMSAWKYVKEYICNVKWMLMDNGGHTLPACKSSAPIPSDYWPELDVLAELNDQMASRYQ